MPRSAGGYSDQIQAAQSASFDEHARIELDLHPALQQMDQDMRATFGREMMIKDGVEVAERTRRNADPVAGLENPSLFINGSDVRQALFESADNLLADGGGVGPEGDDVPHPGNVL